MDVYGNSGIEPSRTIRAVPVRIGDAERDRAVAALGDHFAAGRITREELDERVDRAIAARFEGDLTELFIDLPATPIAAPAATPAVRPKRSATVVPAAAGLLWALLPILMVAVVTTSLIVGAPWLLWTLVWMVVLTGGGRRMVVVRQPHGHGPGHGR